MHPREKGRGFHHSTWLAVRVVKALLPLEKRPNTDEALQEPGPFFTLVVSSFNPHTSLRPLELVSSLRWGNCSTEGQAATTVTQPSVDRNPKPEPSRSKAHKPLSRMGLTGAPSRCNLLTATSLQLRWELRPCSFKESMELDAWLEGGNVSWEPRSKAGCT